MSDKKLMERKGIVYPVIRKLDTKPIKYELVPEVKRLFARE